MGYAHFDMMNCTQTKRVVATSRDELEQSFQQHPSPLCGRFSISLSDSEHLTFDEKKFSFAQACRVAEVGSHALSQWVGSGFRLARPGHRVPRSTDLARICAVRETVCLDVPLSIAFGFAEEVAKSILYYALRSRPDLTIVRKRHGQQYRKTPSDLGANEGYLAQFLGAPLPHFAKISPSCTVSFSEKAECEDHVEHVVLDLEDVGLRLAARSGLLAGMVVWNTAHQ